MKKANGFVPAIGDQVETSQGIGIVDKEVAAHETINDRIFLINFPGSTIPFRSFLLKTLKPVDGKHKTSKAEPKINDTFIGSRWQSVKTGQTFRLSKVTKDGMVHLNPEKGGAWYGVKVANLEKIYTRIPDGE